MGFSLGVPIRENKYGKIISKIIDKVKNLEQVISFEYNGSKEDFTHALDYFNQNMIHDGVEIEQLNNNYKLKFNYKPEYECAMYFRSKSLESRLSPEAKELMKYTKDLVNSIEDRGEGLRGLALAIHDKILEGKQYDKNAPDCHSALGMYRNNRAVCDGFSLAYKVACEYAGLECEAVSGISKGERHAWNIIKLEDGLWHNVDVTYDLGCPVPHKFFDLNDSEFWEDRNINEFSPRAEENYWV